MYSYPCSRKTNICFIIITFKTIYMYLHLEKEWKLCKFIDFMNIIKNLSSKNFLNVLQVSKHLKFAFTGGIQVWITRSRCGRIVFYLFSHIFSFYGKEGDLVPVMLLSLVIFQWMKSCSLPLIFFCYTLIKKGKKDKQEYKETHDTLKQIYWFSQVGLSLEISFLFFITWFSTEKT